MQKTGRFSRFSPFSPQRSPDSLLPLTGSLDRMFFTLDGMIVQKYVWKLPKFSSKPHLHWCCSHSARPRCAKGATSQTLRLFGCMFAGNLEFTKHLVSGFWLPTTDWKLSTTPTPPLPPIVSLSQFRCLCLVVRSWSYPQNLNAVRKKFRRSVPRWFFFFHLVRCDLKN